MRRFRVTRKRTILLHCHAGDDVTFLNAETPARAIWRVIKRDREIWNPREQKHSDYRVREIPPIHGNMDLGDGLWYLLPVTPKRREAA